MKKTFKIFGVLTLAESNFSTNTSRPFRVGTGGM